MSSYDYHLAKAKVLEGAFNIYMSLAVGFGVSQFVLLAGRGVWIWLALGLSVFCFLAMLIVSGLLLYSLHRIDRAYQREKSET